MKTTKEIGNFGEDVATSYLEEKGYEILERNFNLKVGEIDIIALSPENECVFVEVKTRSSEAFGLACEAVDRKKQKRIINAAKLYDYNGDMRFDVIEVYYEKDEDISIKKINHIEDAFWEN